MRKHLRNWTRKSEFQLDFLLIYYSIICQLLYHKLWQPSSFDQSIGGQNPFSCKHILDATSNIVIYSCVQNYFIPGRTAHTTHTHYCRGEPYKTHQLGKMAHAINSSKYLHMWLFMTKFFAFLIKTQILYSSHMKNVCHNY